MFRLILAPAIVFLLFVVVWHSACIFFDIPTYLIPTPGQVVEAIYNNFSSLLNDSAITAYEALAGFLIANVISFILAIVFCHLRWFERSVYPYIIALKSTPVVAMAPLFIIWFGYGYLSKILMAAVVAFFPLVVNATLGLKAVPAEALDLMRSYSASRWQILYTVRFPYAIPYIFSALKVSSTMAVVGAVIAEISGAQKGIGYVITITSYTHDTPLLFGALLAASAIGILFFIAIVILEKPLFRYQTRTEVLL